MLGNAVVSMLDMPDVRGLKVLRAGLHLGECRGKIFIPDHAWALSCTPPAFPRVELDDQEALSWIHGETISRDVNGWVLMCVQGLPLGWGKGSDGMIKNHYPKGLRR